MMNAQLPLAAGDLRASGCVNAILAGCIDSVLNNMLLMHVSLECHALFRGFRNAERNWSLFIVSCHGVMTFG